MKQIFKTLEKCNHTKMGEMKCCVSVFEEVCCDQCIVDEIKYLRSKGINTINSCCGHGNKNLAVLIVRGADAREKMLQLGYREFKEWEYTSDFCNAWFLKTIMPYEKEWNSDFIELNRREI